MNRRWRVLSAVPAALLVLVAAAQVPLAKSGPLSPWKGGGFGMFASLDGGPFRSVKIIVSAETGSEEVIPRARTAELAAKVAMFPTGRGMERLAREVVLDELDRGLPVSAVQVEVWKTDFARRLPTANARLLARRSLDVSAAVDRARD